MNCYTSNSHEPSLADLSYQSCHGHAMPGGATPDGKRRAMTFAAKIKALKAEVSSFGPFFHNPRNSSAKGIVSCFGLSFKSRLCSSLVIQCLSPEVYKIFYYELASLKSSWVGRGSQFQGLKLQRKFVTSYYIWWWPWCLSKVFMTKKIDNESWRALTHVNRSLLHRQAALS